MLSRKSPAIKNYNFYKNINPNVTSKLEAGLYVTSTPIGNLKDFTIRGIEILHHVDIIACEDTRRSRKLLNFYNIKNNLISYHDHNEEKVLPKLLSILLDGKSIALISDSGTPLINDPGFKLVSKCIKKGISVIPIPGACSIVTALSVSGVPTNKFVFLGFFPTKLNEKKKLISLINIFKGSIVFFETPKRLIKTLDYLRNYFPERNVSICKELTKLHEKIYFDKISNILSNPELKNPKGEYVLILGPQLNDNTDIQDIDTLLFEALNLMKVSEAVNQVSALTGTKKKELYNKALNLKKIIQHKKSLS
ncbi:MAG: Ribosomal RNA small subunit methyltransferase I [Alphaproteobacteria bacterium MarineAlpha2_Bin1]|nr:MAG: Ribosomal RNA small subunit methyltransferase I [Alphaproteobacteria bacterium MarineAlpha2_Bin1]|tara:strand:- start:899 stop:1822 length:924 start_codon:yes stop_codon:yes gene_type:complete